MAQTSITVTGSSEIDLLSRKKTIEKVNSLSTDQLKRVLKLIESPKAIKYLSNDIQFAILNKFL